MRQIVILFFTFLGICKGFAQSPDATSSTDSLKTTVAAQPVKNDANLKEKPSARLFPNPAKNKVELEVKGLEPGFVQLQIVDAKGNKLRDDKRLLFSGNESIVVMFSLSPGMYYIQLKQNNTVLRKKLMVQ